MSETTESHAYAELAKPKWNNRTYIDIGSPEIKGKYWSGDYLYQKQQKYYTYLNQYNNGQRNGPCRWNDQREILVENLHLIDAISSVLPLTISQKERAIKLFQTFDFQEEGIRKVIFGCCLALYLVHSDPRDLRKCHPQTPKEDKDEIYEMVIDKYHITPTQIESNYGKVQSRLRGKRVH